MGKGVGQMAELCREAKVACVAIGGEVAKEAKRSPLFAAVFGLSEVTTAAEAMENAGGWLETVAERVARDF
jgi:hypothetical protein